jgi:hypothetical protein
MKPLWIEDPLPAVYSESWAALKRQSPWERNFVMATSE